MWQEQADRRPWQPSRAFIKQILEQSHRRMRHVGPLPFWPKSSQWNSHVPRFTQLQTSQGRGLGHLPGCDNALGPTSTLGSPDVPPTSPPSSSRGPQLQAQTEAQKWWEVRAALPREADSLGSTAGPLGKSGVPESWGEPQGSLGPAGRQECRSIPPPRLPGQLCSAGGEPRTFVCLHSSGMWNQSRETRSLFSFQKRGLNSDPWRSPSSQPDLQSVLHYFTSHAFADFARNVSPALSPSQPAVSVFF